MLTVSDVLAFVQFSKSVLSVTEIRPGVIRIGTTYAYQDGDHVNVYVWELEDEPKVYRMSDCGRTTAQMDNYLCGDPTPDLAPALALTAVQFDDGELYFGRVTPNGFELRLAELASTCASADLYTLSFKRWS